MIPQLPKLFINYKMLFFCSLGVVTSFLAMLFGYNTVSYVLLFVLSVAVLVPLLQEMIHNIRNGVYGVDVLAATALIAALAMGEVWVAAIIAIMLTTGRALEEFAMSRAKAELSALLSRAPKNAHKINENDTVDVAVTELVTDDMISIRPGEIIPIDAVVMEGTASVDEASLTGESLPVAKTVGDEILSGTVNLDGMLVARVLRVAEDSQYQQIVKLVSNASTQRSPFVRMADRYAVPFTVFAFAVAGIAWAMSGDSMRFLQVLVVATPCPLILAAPIAIVSGMSRSAKHGIIIKNGGALEQLARAKTIAFDKTGTLTHGELVVDAVVAFGALSTKDILGYAAALETHSNHVVAQAIVQKAKTEKSDKHDAKKVQEFAGLGLKAHIGLKEILIGRRQLLDQYHITYPDTLDPASLQAQTAAYVAVNGKAVGVITFRDQIRAESSATIQILQTLGIVHTLMVTGDNKHTAHKVATQLGITRVIAHALPADKLQAIQAIPAHERPVAFVGDGINDAPVLTAADVGIALGAKGATAASESADIVVMQDSVASVARAVAISKRTIRIARQSILIGIGLSVVLMLVFASGKFLPIYGALIQEIVDVIVIINALRAHHGDKIETLISRASNSSGGQQIDWLQRPMYLQK